MTIQVLVFLYVVYVCRIEIILLKRLERLLLYFFPRNATVVPSVELLSHYSSLVLCAFLYLDDRPMYGSHFFYSLKVQCVPDLLSNLPSNLLLSFNADGMHIFSVDKKELLQQYSYADVHSWRGTRRQVISL